MEINIHSFITLWILIEIIKFSCCSSLLRASFISPTLIDCGVACRRFLWVHFIVSGLGGWIIGLIFTRPDRLNWRKRVTQWGCEATHRLKYVSNQSQYNQSVSWTVIALLLWITSAQASRRESVFCSLTRRGVANNFLWTCSNYFSHFLSRNNGKSKW